MGVVAENISSREFVGNLYAWSLLSKELALVRLDLMLQPVSPFAQAGLIALCDSA
jgi:hypothetical protein